jgi:S1-C subfamily serine protease
VAENGKQGLSSEGRKVPPGSPAEKAGLLPEDRLNAAEGIEITLTLLREGKKKEITVQLLPSED